ncbi:hypothetical protein [Sulfurimonas microaerophilic]|uniref:hypothetical protein n=1 Tax=Sulfurimonas microaerophilic TaxID=3058392 RepID=UPI0027149B4C|nr:hypothetical protein [Sulfurimonas sp. hsl 1-7]
MKNSLTKLALATSIAAMPLMADYTFNTKSLFAIEGGYSDLGANVYDSGVGISNLGKENGGMGTIGLKVGAQTENYRIFISARHYDADKLSRLNTYGAEAQYMFNFSEPVNFFVGINGGIANLRVTGTTTYDTAYENLNYIGGDLGFNYHATELVDVELGYRFMTFKDDIERSTYTYQLDRLQTFYVSAIIKWDMD